MSATKRETRKLTRKLMASMSPEDKVDLAFKTSTRLCDLLENLRQKISFPDKPVFGVYSPLADEPDWTLNFTSVEFELAFPAWISDGEMVFKTSTLSGLNPQKSFGVEMGLPTEGAPIVEPSFFLVPGVAFTEDGHRLGRGKGYYDRYLNEHVGIKIGICFEFQIMDQLEMEAHDVLMDYIVTEERLINCSKTE